MPASGLRLLVIDVGDAPAAASLWPVIVELSEQIPADGRLLLLSRALPVQACVHWRNQGRLQLLDHSVLTLHAEEWQEAGLNAVGQCAHGAGWWGPAAWLQAGSGAWGTTLGEWVAEVWFPTLAGPQRALLGQLSLLPHNAVEALAELYNYQIAMLESWLRELDALCGALQWAEGRVGIKDHFRLAITEAWRRVDTQAWTAAVLSTLEAELCRSRLQGAAQLADESGLGLARRRVMQGAGLYMLYTSQRAMLGRWLAAPLDLEEPALFVLHCAWLVEVEKSAHRADAELRRGLSQLGGSARCHALVLQATIALDYEECERAEALASSALDGFEDDRQPLAIRACITRGCARAAMGRLDEAAEDLRIAQLCAEREQLEWLQLDSLQRRALLAAEQGQGQGREAQVWLQGALELSRRAHLQNSSTADSCRRQQAWLHLEMLDAAAARQVREAAQAFWAFPQHVHLALEALLEDQLDAARRAADWLMRMVDTSFQPRKWQNQAAWIDIWIAAHDNNRQRLLHWEGQLAAEGWPNDAQADRRRILLAGVRCLLGVADERHTLEALLARLHRRGAGALALQLQLILALQSEDAARFQACVEAGARARAHLDYLWLGPRVTPLLQERLCSPQSGCNAELHAFVRRLLQRLLAPLRAGVVPQEAPIPGLTAKETQILRLIGQHYNNEQIAAALFISQATVKTHINHIYSKLALQSRNEAIQRARQLFI